MASKTRYAHIDFIRALAIIGVITTHVLSLHLGDNFINIVWNYLHFAVVGLVFCSAYIYAAGNQHENQSTFSLELFKKRFLRLYAPFFAYIIVHYLLWFTFPGWFHGYGIKKSMDFFISSITLTGGIDFGWLPLLFIQLAIASPFILSAARKPHLNRLLLIFFGIWTIVTTFFRIPIVYSRAVAWIPWSFILLLGFMYSDAETHNLSAVRRSLLKILSGSIIVWVILYGVLTALGKNLTLTVHKYPPDLFYFAYGIAITCVMLLVFPQYVKRSSHGHKIITFLSTHAYTIFFLHYIVLDVMTRAG